MEPTIKDLSNQIDSLKITVYSQHLEILGLLAQLAKVFQSK
jgi:hypothetical protein